MVKKCCDKDSNESYAAKCIKKKRTAASKHGQSREHIEREASILKSLNHDGIIRLYDLFETRHEVILILEL